VLDRDFTAAAPNQRWVGDTTEFVIGENAKLCLAAILDLCQISPVGSHSFLLDRGPLQPRRAYRSPVDFRS
jgi:hypothetical protein